MPTGAEKVDTSFSLSFNVPEGSADDFSAMEIAVPVMVVGGSECAVRSDWVGNEEGGSCPWLLWVSLE